MKNRIIKFILNRKIHRLQKNMKKQEKKIKLILNTLDEIEPKWKEIKINKW